jgi:hypothetical protein
MSQAFGGAAPKVLNGKPKYSSNQMGKENANPNMNDDQEMMSNTFNIMYDKRVFRGNTHGVNVLKGPAAEKGLTPAQRDELRFKAEREKKKFEMIKTQLVEFKKAKNKISPYDLRPGPPARIEVDLTYFLTEQGVEKPEEVDSKIQTDDFVVRPETPTYVPKKTGIDKIT